MWQNNRYWVALKHHYSASLDTVFKQFRLGAAIFFTGMVGVYSGYHMESSWPQEIILAISLVVVALGFLLAMLAHIRMVIIRIINFIKDR
ncbi:hypothetical protein [Halioxenophilus aromaticivorans]|uniref:DUF202 domain-containing protein n=1 Tax=Halioxenophilus aromaticivorans TaxID=1306992 RepID=A0AAV3TZ24_9ALTE